MNTILFLMIRYSEAHGLPLYVLPVSHLNKYNDAFHLFKLMLVLCVMDKVVRILKFFVASGNDLFQRHLICCYPWQSYHKHEGK